MLDGLDDISYGIAHITFIVTFKFTLKLVLVSSVIAPHCLNTNNEPSSRSIDAVAYPLLYYHLIPVNAR